VVSYSASPAAEVYYAEQPPESAPTAVLVENGSAFRQIEFAGILKGTQQRAQAEKFVDFMLGQQFQEDLPLQMFVFPVNMSAQLPPEFVENVQIPDQPASLSPQMIDANREAWIEAWSNTVLE
jgi:thiamine transport system substrate-binding protein